ncbi:MAG TPA: GNAT family N-acetyltransferase [Opitutaceae bacterium]|nr:GNAT family N-acetyltransferase [Opitutaceae bacterium]
MHAQAAVAIRRAAAADLPAVLALYREVGDRATIPLGRARRVLARMRSYPDYDLYVASSGGEIVGTFALLIMDNLAHLAAPSGVIEDVVVRRDWQGRGIGRRMMQWARQRCRARGCYKLALSSSRHRRAAHRFYATLGFRRHGFSFRLELPGRRPRRRST